MKERTSSGSGRGRPDPKSFVRQGHKSTALQLSLFIHSMPFQYLHLGEAMQGNGWLIFAAGLKQG